MTRFPYRSTAVAAAALALSGVLIHRISSITVVRHSPECEELTSPSNAYITYKTSIEKLQKGKSFTQSNAACLLPEGSLVSSDPTIARQKILESNFNSDVLYTAIQKKLSSIIDEDKSLGLKRKASLAWAGVYLSEASLIAFEKTGERRFLDLVRDHTNELIKRRDDQLNRTDQLRGRVMKAWGSTNLTADRKRYGNASQWISHVTHNARIVFPATEFARIVKSDPSLSDYTDSADQFIRVAEETLAEFEEDYKATPGYKGIQWYYRPIVDKYEATNHLHMIARTWSNLAALTGKAAYSDRSRQVFDIFMRGANKEPGGLLSWQYAPFFVNEKEGKKYRNNEDYSEPIWKATLTSQFLLQSHVQNGYPDTETIRSIAKGFNNVTFRNNGIWRNVAMRESRFFDPKSDGINPNVVTLASYSTLEPDIGRKIKKLVATRADIFPNGWLFPEGLLAYAYFLGTDQPPSHQSQP